MTAVAVVELEGLTRADWLEARRGGIGGSDAPAIAGLDKFRSPFVTYLDKIGEADEREETEAMHWGTAFEDALAQEFATRNGLVVKKPAALYRHELYDWMFANVDREVYTPDGEFFAGLELKTSGVPEEWAENPPERVLIQCHHYLAVMGWERMYVAVLLHTWGGWKYQQWLIERDDELLGLLLEIEAKFWNHVVDRVPPPVDGHPSTTEALNALYALAEGGSVVELDADALGEHAELAKAKQMVKDAQADVDALSNALKARMGAHEVATYEGQTLVTWKQTKARERKHSCPDCTHTPDGPPSRQFLLK